MPRLQRLLSLLFLLVIAVTGMAAIGAFRSYAAPGAVAPGWLDGELAKRFEAHYDAEFPLKRLATNLWAAISLTLFDEGRPGVVLGRAGWLYTDEEFTVQDDSLDHIAANLATIRRVDADLRGLGLPLLVVVVPAKARVYADQLGRRRPPALQRRLHALLIDSLIADNIAHVDLLATLSSARSSGPVFFRGDSHWTPYGAERAARQAAAIAGERGLRVAAAGRQPHQTRQAAEVPYRGDLFNYLPLEPWFPGLLPAYDRVAIPRTDAVAGRRPAAGSATALFGDAAPPALVLIGSSYSANPIWNFAGALAEAFAEPVTNLALEGIGPFRPMQRYLDGPELSRSPPRLVIWEIPERSMLLAPVAEPAAPTPAQKPETLSADLVIAG